MPGLILPQRFNAQPQGALQLDRSNPIASSITHMMPLNGDLREIVTGNRITLTSTGKIEPTSRGLALRGNGTQSVGSIPLDLSAANFIVISFWLWWDAYANDDDLAIEFTPNQNTNNGGFFVDPNASVGRIQVNSTIVGSGNKAASYARPSAATWHHHLVGIDRAAAANSGHFFYVDGVSQTVTNDLNTASGGEFANSTLYFFSRASTSLFGAGRLQNLTFRLGNLAAYNNAALIAREEYRNPWQVFKAPPKRIFFGAAGGPTTYNVDQTDAATLSDAVTSAAIFGSAQTDALTLAETEVGMAVFPVSQTDAATLADSQSTSGATYAVSQSDALTLADSQAGLAVFPGALSESIALADAPAALVVFASSQADALTLADSHNASVGGGAVYDVSQSEAMSLADSSTSLCVFPSALIEPAALADAVAATGIFPAVSSDAISLADTQTAPATGSGTGATAAEIWAYEIEPGVTAKMAMQRILAVLGGKVSGAGSGTETFRDINDTRDALVSVNDASGNRSSLTWTDGA